MNADTCRDFIRALELYHDKKLSSAARDAYWAGLKGYDDEKIVLLMQASYGKFPPGRVPSLSDLKSLLGEISETAQGKEPAGRHPLWRSPRSSRPMIDEAFAMLEKLLGESDRITARQCVGEMLKMEEKYPGVGWQEKAAQFSALLDEKERREKEEAEKMDLVDEELRQIENRAREELAKDGAKNSHFVD